MRFVVLDAVFVIIPLILRHTNPVVPEYNEYSPLPKSVVRETVPAAALNDKLAYAKYIPAATPVI
jgi:hypothetical protein